jgi:hypothetical protein
MDKATLPAFLQSRTRERVQAMSNRVLKAARAVQAKWMETDIPQKLVADGTIVAPLSDGAAAAAQLDEAVLKYILKVVYQSAIIEQCNSSTANKPAVVELWDTTQELYVDAARTSVFETTPSSGAAALRYFMPYVASVLCMYTSLSSFDTLLAPLLAAARADPQMMHDEYVSVTDDLSTGATPMYNFDVMAPGVRMKLLRQRHYADERVLVGPPLAKHAEAFVKNSAVLGHI